ncbi:MULTISPECIES: ADP-ribosylglycohydrolase family protein, partial [Pseudomonas]|uniref:ADP-ribosylglycohydrolase family protein n=1 Tax=Pseudomonas TaxID=286 RepID=UPI002F267636
MNRLERIRGCLLGGAVGDALGAPVATLGWPAIEARLRIPRHPATQSTLIWPGIPRPSGHLFHGHPAGQ